MHFSSSIALCALTTIGLSVLTVSSSPTPTADPDPGLGWLWPAKQDTSTATWPTIGHASPQLHGEEWLQSIRQQSEDELMLLEQGRSSIQKYQANSHDCYKEAAAMLQKGCKELTIKQEEKIQYAVRLTMCEVATANMNVPSSCSQANPPSACVEALAQVPQLWTSYSGYFREVMAMCYAVRHQIERELVESLFYNLTLAQLVNTNVLQQHAKDMAALHARELDTLHAVSKTQEELKSHAQELGTWANTMSRDVGSIESQMSTVAKTVQEVDRAQKEVELALRSSKEETLKWMQGAREDTVNLRQSLQVVSHEVGKHFQDQQRAQEATHQLLKAVAQVFNATTAHTSSLAATLVHLNSTMAAHAHDLDQLLRSQLTYFQRMSTAVQQLESQQHHAMVSTMAWFAQVQQMHKALVENMTYTAREMQESQAKQHDQLDSVTQALKELQKQTEAATSSFGVVTKMLGFVSGENATVVMLALVGVVAFRVLGPTGIGVFVVAYGIRAMSETPTPNFLYAVGALTISSVVFLLWARRETIPAAVVFRRPHPMAQESNVAPMLSSSAQPSPLDSPLTIRTLQRPSKRSQATTTSWKRYRPSQLFSLDSSQRSNQSE